MSWLGELLRTRTTDWFFGRIDTVDPAPTLGTRVIVPETSYLSVILRSLFVPYSRRGVNRVYGAVSSHCTLAHRGGGRAEFFVLTAPPDLKGTEARHADRVLTINKRLAGPVPYRGGDVELQLALLSVKGSDLAGPYLEVLETLASIAGVAFISPALVLARPLQRGIDLLLGGADPAVLEVGLATTFLRPETGVYCLIAAPKHEIEPSGLCLGADFRLMGGDGHPFSDYPYLVVSLEAADRRDDWTELPGVRDAYQDLVRAVERSDFNTVKDALGAFRRVAVTSPDLLAVDGARLAEMVSREVSLALGAVPTARSDGPRIRPLDELELFAS